MKKNLINLLLVTLVLASCKKNVPNIPKNTNNNPQAVKNPPADGNPQGSILGEIPNARFENWIIENGQEIPEGWSGGLLLIRGGVSKTTDKHSGNYALLLETTEKLFPEIVNKGSVFGFENNFAYSHRPKSLDFYYKYIPEKERENNPIVFMTLTKWNPTTKKSEFVSTPILYILTPSSSYIQERIPIEYKTLDAPDSVCIRMFFRKPCVGSSKLYIDDLAFSK